MLSRRCFTTDGADSDDGSLGVLAFQTLSYISEGCQHFKQYSYANRHFSCCPAGAAQCDDAGAGDDDVGVSGEAPFPSNPAFLLPAKVSQRIAQALHNVTTLTRATTVSAFQTLSYISEGCIFIYMGMDTLDPVKWRVRKLIRDMFSCLPKQTRKDLQP